MTLKPPNPRARALDLAIPVASCMAAGIGTGHLLDGLTRDELAALVNLLAFAASTDPVGLRAVVSAGDGMTAPMVSRAALLRKAHAEAVRLRAAGVDVPARVRVLDGEYRRERERVTGRRRRAAPPRVKAAPVPRELEPCPSLAAYRRHKAAGEPFEECGCGDAARAVWRASKRAA